MVFSNQTIDYSSNVRWSGKKGHAHWFLLIKDSDLLIFHREQLSKSHRGVNSCIKILTGTPVSLLVSDVSLNCLAVKSVIFSGFFE
jgi:hypothetical protein